MARNTVVVSITSNIRGLTKGLSDGESKLSRFGKVAGRVAAATGVVAAAIGVKAVKSASELEQSMGGLEAVFKGNIGQMTEWANKAAGSVGLAKSEYASLSTVLGAQLKNMGVETSALGTQTNDLVKLGADLAAQFGGSTSDAVGALSSLLRGERDPIERYGVSINEAAVKAKMAELGLSGLSGEAEKNAKLQATLALLTQQTADAQGAFARESTTLAGSQQRLGAGLENLSATFGGALLPAVTAVTAAAGAMVNKLSESEWFQSLTANLTAGSEKFADFVFGILNGTSSLDFGSMFAGILPAMVNGIQAASAWLVSGGAAQIVNGIIAAREGVFGAAMQVFPAILEALIAAIPSIVAGIVALVTALAGMLQTQIPVILDGAVLLFTGLIDGLVQIIPPLLTALVGLLPVILDTVIGMIPKLLDAAIAVFMALVEAIPQIIPPLLAALIALVPKLITTVLGMIPKLLDAAINLFLSLVEAIPKILPQLLNAVVTLAPKIVVQIIKMIPKILTAAIQLFTGLIKAIPKILPELLRAVIGMIPEIVKALIGMVPELLQVGVDLVRGLIDGILSMGGAIIEAIGGVVGSAIDWAKSLLGIKSPSRVFKSIGKYVGQGFVIGVTSTRDKVQATMAGLVDKVRDSFDRVSEDRKKAGDKLSALNKRYADIDQKIADTLASKASASRARRLRDLYQDRNEIQGLINSQRNTIADYDRFIANGARERKALDTIRSANRELKTLAAAREKISQRLDAARDSLADLRDARSGAIADIKKSVVALGNIGGLSTATGMVEQLRSQINATNAFRATLSKLKGLGLDATSQDQLLQDFLRSGSTAAADALLAGGASAVAQVAEMQAQLERQGKALGVTIGDDMYLAGIRAAQGLVKGLEAEKNGIDKIAERLANSLVATVKKTLGIKSPSRVFRELGKFTVQGLSKGIDGTARTAVRSVNSLARAVETGFNTELARPSLAPITPSAGVSARATTPAVVPGNTYEITVKGLAPSAEIGRAVVDAIASYERLRTSRPAGALA